MLNRDEMHIANIERLNEFYNILHYHIKNDLVTLEKNHIIKIRTYGGTDYKYMQWGIEYMKCTVVLEYINDNYGEISNYIKGVKILC